MKLFRLYLSFLIFIVFTFSKSSSAATLPNHSPADSTSFANAYTIIKKSTNKDIAKLIGRKLTVKEKMSLWAVRRFTEVDAATQKKANSKALVGFLLSLAGILVFPLLPSIAAIVLTNQALKMDKEQPGALSKNKDLAQIGRVIGIIGVALNVLLIILVAIILTNIHYR